MARREIYSPMSLRMFAILSTTVFAALGCSAKHTDENLNSVTDTSKTDATGTASDSTDPELPAPDLLYELIVNDERIEIFSIDVQGDFIYFTTVSSFNRLPKKGNGVYENIGPRPYAGSSQFMVAEDPYIYRPIPSGVTKYNTETKEEAIFDLTEYVASIGLITGDENRLYVGGDGSSLQISFDKDGEDIISYGVEKNPDYYGMAYTVTDDTYIYFSGGGRGDTAGQILRVPKSGGEIEVVTTVPEVDDPDYAHAGPQAGAMVLVGDQIYFINHYAASATLLQYLAVAPKTGGETTRLVKLLYTTNTQRIFYDKKRNAVYFYTSGHESDSGIYKYDLAKEKISRFAFKKAGLAPLAADEDYLYWAAINEIYRLKKF